MASFIRTYLDTVGNNVHMLYGDFNGEEVPLAGLVYEEAITVDDFKDPPEFATYMTALQCIEFLQRSGYGTTFKT